MKKKWDASPIAAKFAKRAQRASLNDFDRFKVMINRKKRSFKVRQLAKKLVGGDKAAPAKGAKAGQEAKGAKG